MDLVLDPRSMLVPGHPVPDLAVTLTSGVPYRLRDELLRNRYVIVEVYRGAHCSICAAHLRELDGRYDELAAHGAATIAVSMNERVVALEGALAWNLSRLPLGYGLDAATARKWGLYFSTRIKETEPALFVEPATFVVRHDGTLYAADIRSSPHFRPQIDRLVTLIRRAEEGYPPRGTARSSFSER
jgi:peroxiredoxin